MATFYYKRYRWFTKRPKSPYVVRSTSNVTLSQTATFENQQTFETPTVGRGAVNLAPTLFENAQTFNTHTLTTLTALTQTTRFDNSQTFNTHVVAAGAVNLAASIFNNSQTFDTHTVGRGTVNLAHTLYENAQTFNTHAITTLTALTASLFSNSQTFNTHTLAAGAVNLAPSIFNNDQTYNTHIISAGDTILEPSLFTNSQTYVTHTLAVGAVNLSASLFSNSQTFNTHTLAVGTVNLQPTLFENAQTFNSHELEGVAEQALTVNALLENTSVFITNPGTDDFIRNWGQAVSGARRLGQRFTVASTVSIKNVQVKLVKAGSPVDNIQLELWETTGHPESGSQIATAVVVNGAALPDGPTQTMINFTFASAQTLAPGTYAFTLERSGSVDNANYYQIVEDLDDNYAGGNAWIRDDTATWFEQGTDWCFRVDAATGQEFFTHDLFAVGVLSPSLFSNAQTYYTHVLAQGTQALEQTQRIENRVVEQSTGESSAVDFGTNTVLRLAQTFTVPRTITLRSIRTAMTADGAPTDTVALEVRTFVTTPEGGSLLGTSYALKAGGLNHNPDEFYFDPITLTVGTQYEIVYKRSGALDDTNFYKLFRSSSDNYANGSAWAFTGGAWAEQASVDYRFNIIEYFSEIYYPPTIASGPAPPLIVPLIQNNNVIEQTTGTNDYAFGHTTDQRIAQRYISPVDPSMRVRSITLELYKVGNPLDQVYLTINNVAGDPDASGSVAVSTSVAGSTISSNSGSRSAVTFYFPPSQVAELEGAHWFFKLQRTDALDASNYYVVTRTAADAYADGAAWTYNGSWTEQSTDLKFTVEELFSVGFYRGTLSMNIAPALYENAQTFYTPQVDLIIYPSLFSNTQTFYTPQVDLIIYPSLFSNTQTFYQGLITLYLVPQLYENTQTFYSPKVDLIIYPSLFSNTQTFYSPKVDLIIHASLFENAQTFFTPNVSQLVGGVNDVRIDNAQTFFTPIVARGPVHTFPERADFDQTFFTATISLNLNGTLFTNTQTFYTHVVFNFGQVLEPVLWENTQTFNTHSIDLNDQFLPADRFDNEQTFYSHSLVIVNTLLPTLFDNSLSFTVFTHDMRGYMEQDHYADLHENRQVFYPAAIENLKRLRMKIRRGRV